MLFDDQAENFDKRAGLPPGVPEAIAHAMASLLKPRKGCVLLEIGAGTGEIGMHLSDSSNGYLGLDLSYPMLKAFRIRAGGAKANLVHADGDAPWPIGTGKVHAVFGSRSLHYIRPGHFASELARVGLGGEVAVIMGSVHREEASVKDVMRREMRQRLKAKGFQGRGGRRGKMGLWQELGERGGRELEPLTVSTWTVSSSPKASLDSWESKAGLAGLEVPEDVKRSVLDELREWATEHYGRLDDAIPGKETYVLEGMIVAI